jgi:hypothetical protein
MIRIKNLEQVAPRAFLKARAERPWVTRLEDRTYKVVPRRAGKPKYVVTFEVRDGQRFAECRNLHTQELCPSQAHVGHEKVCYHVATAYRRHIKNARRDRDRQQPKSQQSVAAPAPSSSPTVRATPQPASSPKQSAAVLLVTTGDIRFRKAERVRGITI